jgi:protein required for attachment to host cells
MIEQKDAEKLGKFDRAGEGKEKNKNLTQRAERTPRPGRGKRRAQRREEKADSSLRSE